MAIFAERSAFRTSAYIPDIKIVGGSTPSNQQILIWSSSEQAFVNGDISCILPAGSGGGSGTITGGANLGSGGQIFEGIDSSGTLLEFRTLRAGPGISIGVDVDAVGEITISNTAFTSGQISSDDDFTIVIDSDGDSTDAVFQVSTLRSLALVEVEPIVYNAANLDIQVVTDPTFTNKGQFISQSANFVALGFEAEMCLNVSGVTEQDGEYDIESVSGGTITVTIPFTDPTDAGLQPATILTATPFRIIDSRNMRILGFDFAAAGFVAGQTVELVGTDDNDGTFTIDTITNDIVTIVETFPGTVGCDFNTIIFRTPEEILPTGFQVDEGGNLNANDTVICGDLTVGCGGNLSVAGTLTVGGLGIGDLIDPYLPVFPDNGIIVQVSEGTFVGREIMAGPGIVVTNGDGVAADPEISADNFDLTFTGDATGTGTVTQLNDTSIALTLANSGVNFGEYNLVTVDTKGRVITGIKRNIDAGPGITVDNGTWTGGNPTIHPNDFSITLTGDIEGTATVTDLSNTSITTTLATQPAGGQLALSPWNRVSVNSSGLVVAGYNQAILAGAGITITNGNSANINPIIIAPNDFTLAFSGDVIGSGTVTDLSNTSINLSLTDIINPGTYNQVVVDSTGRVTAGFNIDLDFQPADPILDDLVSPMFDPGYLVWNGSYYTDNQIVGIQDETIVVNGDGLGGDTIIGLADNPILPGNASVTIPFGSDLQRPSSPTNGMIRYNTNTDEFEGYKDGSWVDFFTGTLGNYLELAGGTMQGDIAMGNNNITFSTGLVDGRDVSADGALLDLIYTGTGFKVQTAANTIVNRELEVELLSGLTISNGDGVTGNPTLGFDASNFELSSFEPSAETDLMMYYDSSESTTKVAKISKINRRQAFRYYWAQL